MANQERPRTRAIGIAQLRSILKGYIISRMLCKFSLMFALWLWIMKTFNLLLQMQPCQHINVIVRLGVVQLTELLKHWRAMPMTRVQGSSTNLDIFSLSYFYALLAIKKIRIFRKKIMHYII